MKVSFQRSATNCAWILFDEAKMHCLPIPQVYWNSIANPKTMILDTEYWLNRKITSGPSAKDSYSEHCSPVNYGGEGKRGFHAYESKLLSQTKSKLFWDVLM